MYRVPKSMLPAGLLTGLRHRRDEFSGATGDTADAHRRSPLTRLTARVWFPKEAAACS